MNDILVAPSVLSCDFLHLGDDLSQIGDADLIHYDVMDGHFVPNLSFGLEILRQIKSVTTLPIDVHLIISNPDEMVDAYLEAGANLVSVHVEAARHLHRIVGAIHDAGAKASVVLNPATPLCVLEDILPELDMVLLMSVNPGFGGQRLIESVYPKLRRLRSMCDAAGVNPLIEVDGGVSAANAGKLSAAGAQVLVAGSAVFGAKNRAEAIRAIREAGRAGLTKSV